MKLAIILTGELRFESKEHFDDFYEKIKDFDVYISTYKRYESICRMITPHYTFVDDKNREDEILGFAKSMGSRRLGLWQWFNLSNILKQYKNELLQYDCILKLRTDIIFSKPNLGKVDDYTIYLSTDLVFYGKSAHFINVFDNYFFYMKNFYFDKVGSYLPINYDNILNSDITCTTQVMGLRYNWLILPKIINIKYHLYITQFDENFDQLKENIRKHYDFLTVLNCIVNNKNVSNLEKQIKNLSAEEKEVLKNCVFTTYIYSFCLEETWKFSSEQTLCLHVFNNSFAKNLNFNINEMHNRATFKWGLEL
jgi:hypothetical protein